MRATSPLVLAVFVVACHGHTVTGATVDKAHFHHVRLNAVDPPKTFAFYEKFFGAVKVPYRGSTTDALFTERSYLLADRVATTPASNDGTSLWHIGWSGVDGAAEFRWRVEDGIRVDTPLSKPILPGIENRAEVMYFRGPDGELIEVSTVNRNHRFEHVHLLSSDVAASTKWFQTNLGLAPDRETATDFFGVVMNGIHVDNVHIVLFGRPTPDHGNPFAAKDLWPADGFEPTDGRAVDHLAFSFVDIAPVLERMTRSGVPIVRGIQNDAKFGHKSFFARGPDNVLIEIVEAQSIPDGR